MSCKSLGVGGVIEPTPSHAGVSRRAKTEIVAAVPIDQIVTALITGLRKVGDLVLAVAVVLQLLHSV